MPLIEGTFKIAIDDGYELPDAERLLVGRLTIHSETCTAPSIVLTAARKGG